MRKRITIYKYKLEYVASPTQSYKNIKTQEDYAWVKPTQQQPKSALSDDKKVVVVENINGTKKMYRKNIFDAIHDCNITIADAVKSGLVSLEEILSLID